MAVMQFYHHGASQETHNWLTTAQLSPLAWSFSWELVMPDKKPEVQFFGASTIAIKVQKFWHEVPSDQVSCCDFANFNHDTLVKMINLHKFFFFFSFSIWLFAREY